MKAEPEQELCELRISTYELNIRVLSLTSQALTTHDLPPPLKPAFPVSQQGTQTTFFSNLNSLPLYFVFPLCFPPTDLLYLITDNVKISSPVDVLLAAIIIKLVITSTFLPAGFCYVLCRPFYHNSLQWI